MSRFAARAWPLACALFAYLVLAAAARAACPGADAAPTAASAPAAASATVCVVNEQRAAHGLQPLHADAGLARVAHRYSGNMVEHHFFSHVSPGGSDLHDRIVASGFTGSWTAGEAIGWGAGTLATPSGMVQAWLNSPPHRAILLGHFQEVGVGVAAHRPQGGSGATYTLDAAKRR